MDHRAKEVIKQTWARLEPIADAVIELFYQRLFDQHPELRSLFKRDFGAQKDKLTNTLRIAVGCIDDLESLTPTLRRLGRRHARYGVRTEHYAMMGAALLWAIQQGLRQQYTIEVRAAWMAFYEELSREMIEATEVACIEAAV